LSAAFLYSEKPPDDIAADVISWLTASEDQHAAFPDLNASDAPATPLPSGGGKRGRQGQPASPSGRPENETDDL